LFGLAWLALAVARGRSRLWLASALGAVVLVTLAAIREAPGQLVGGIGFILILLGAGWLVLALWWRLGASTGLYIARLELAARCLLILLSVTILGAGVSNILDGGIRASWLFGDFTRRPAVCISCSQEFEMMYVPDDPTGPKAASGWDVMWTRRTNGRPIRFCSSSTSPSGSLRPNGYSLIGWMQGPIVSGPKLDQIIGHQHTFRLHFVIAAILPVIYPLSTLPKTLRRYCRHRRMAGGLCESCAYNLTGNESGVCPECGQKTEASSENPAFHN
jgi:hypothetical protein